MGIPRTSGWGYLTCRKIKAADVAQTRKAEFLNITEICPLVGAGEKEKKTIPPEGQIAGAPLRFLFSVKVPLDAPWGDGTEPLSQLERADVHLRAIERALRAERRENSNYLALAIRAQRDSAPR